MKKTFAFLLAMIMMLSLAACGGNSAKESGADMTNDNVKQSDTDKETEEAKHEIVDVPESLVGTWYLHLQIGAQVPYSPSGKTAIESEDAIQSFDIAANGTITVNGTEYTLYNPTEKEKQSISYRHLKDFYKVDIEGEQYNLFSFEYSDSNISIYFEPNGNFAAHYDPWYSKKAGKTIELTVDNWQTILEPKIVYYMEKDSFGDVTNISYKVGIYPKDGITITGAEDCAIKGSYKFTERATIHFNPNSEEYTLTDVIGLERVDSMAFNRSNQNKYFQDVMDGKEYLFQIGTEIFTPSITDSEITADVPCNLHVEVNNIKGTVAYLQ